MGLEVAGELGRGSEGRWENLLTWFLSPLRLPESVQSGTVLSLCGDVAPAAGGCGLPPR